MKNYTPALLRKKLFSLNESIESDKGSLEMLNNSPIKANMSIKLLNVEINKKQNKVSEIEKLLVL